MCLITEIKTPFIAEEDMVVYKSLVPFSEKLFISVYFSFYWKLDEIYYSQFNIREGRFSAADTVANNFYRSIDRNSLVSIAEGFHAAFTKERAMEVVNFEEDGCVVVQCTIPKGATYYKDSTGLLVSNQLRVDKIIEENG